jgi:hypothetical protein
MSGWRSTFGGWLAPSTPETKEAATAPSPETIRDRLLGWATKTLVDVATALASPEGRREQLVFLSLTAQALATLTMSIYGADQHDAPAAALQRAFNAFFAAHASHLELVRRPSPLALRVGDDLAALEAALWPAP